MAQSKSPTPREPRRTKQLTAMEVENLKPAAERYTVWGVQGLAVRVDPSGTRTFVYRYRAGDKKRQITLGDYHAKDYPLKAALADLAAAVSVRRSGADPVEKQRADVAQQVEAERQEQAGLLTMRQLFDQWAATDLAPQVGPDGTRHGRKDGGALLRGQFESHVFPTLGGVPARNVSKADVMGLIDKAKAAGKRRTASVLLSALRQMFDFALDREVVDRNPTAALKKKRIVGKDATRTRVLNADGEWQLVRLLQRLPKVDLHPVTVLALHFVLATGQRPGEVAGMPKAELDKDATLWTIPPERYKTGDVHKVPLSDYARALLVQAAAYNHASAYVFPSPQAKPDDDRPVDRHSLSRAVLRKLGTPTPEGDTPAKGTLGLEPFTPHDLRRTCRTGLSALRVAENVAERVIGHKLQGMLAVYDHHDHLPERRAALQAWGEHLAALVQPST